jgi:hypothetical protein
LVAAHDIVTLGLWNQQTPPLSVTTSGSLQIKQHLAGLCGIAAQ